MRVFAAPCRHTQSHLVEISRATMGQKTSGGSVTAVSHNLTSRVNLTPRRWFKMVSPIINILHRIAVGVPRRCSGLVVRMSDIMMLSFSVFFIISLVFFSQK